MNLKQARQLHQITQGELAEKIGLSQTQISHIEAGKCIPRISTRRRIEKALNMRIEWLESRLQQPIKTTGFTENESSEDQWLKATQHYLNTAQRKERMERIQFMKEALKHFEKEELKR